MADTFNSKQRHRIMSAVHSSSTKPELILRHAIWILGFRYRINDHRLPGSPDIVLPKYRTVIFVHGCFWHGHNGCKNYTIPETNTEFWTAKVARNKERDQEVWRQLEALGWSVIIVWECQLKKKCLSGTIESISQDIRHNGEIYVAAKEARKKARDAYRIALREKKEKEARHLLEIGR